MVEQASQGPNEYVYRGARALVQLHERHLRSFIATWKRAAADGVTLPPTDDETCASLDALLRHVLRAARGYMRWICDSLGLDDPGIDEVPEDLSTSLDAYVEALLARWDGPLRTVDERTLDRGTYPSSWGTEYCIDAMLEHAVMHPLRHEFQLERARA